jgi:hypothetical protein
MIGELLTLGFVILVIVVLFNSFSTEEDPGSPGLTFMILAFGLFVGITLFFLARTYFQKSEDLLQFLLAFTMFLLFPISLSSAAATFIGIRTLKETIASA